MLPFFLPAPVYMTFKTYIILFLQGFHQGILFQGLCKLQTLAVVYQKRAYMLYPCFIRTLYCKADALRLCSRQILVSIRFKINHNKTGKQGIDTVDNIPHLRILLFQQFSVSVGPDKEDDDINNKQCKQHGLQTDSHKVFVLYHALGHTFWKGLYQNKFQIGQILHTDVICFTAGITKKYALSALFKNSSCIGCRFFINHAVLQQYFQKVSFIYRSIARAGNYRPVCRAQKHFRRFAEIRGIQHTL